MLLRISIVVCLLFLHFRDGFAQTGPRVLGWRADIDSLTHRIEFTHPNPWARIPREEFVREAKALRDSIPVLSDGRVLVGLMRLAASLHDGHTTVTDVGRNASDKWFPVRFTLFSDGLWVTAIAPAASRAAGKRVLSIGGVLANDVVARLLPIVAGDNDFNHRVKSAVLSNGMVLNALGITSGPDTIHFVVSGEGRTPEKFTLAAAHADASLDFEQWGEMFAPQELRVTTAFGRDPDTLLNPTRNPDLPLHMRGRKAYWWIIDAPSRTLYFQMNNVAAKSRRSPLGLVDTWAEALRAGDSAFAGKGRFVLDLRYNSGGDGSLIPALLRILIRYDSTIAGRGHFFVITGGKTFSAATDLVVTLVRYMQPLLVGEPPGAGFDAAGDAEHITLPYSGAGFQVSTNYWQLVSPADPSSRVIPINISAPMSGEMYFARRDPALEAIGNGTAPYPDVVVALRDSGGAAATAIWRSLPKHTDLPWWEPWRWGDLNKAAYDLMSRGRVDDAIAGFLINAEMYPGKWDSWDSLGEGYLKAGKNADALRSYERALALAPHNWNAGEQKRIVAQLRSGQPR